MPFRRIPAMVRIKSNRRWMSQREREAFQPNRETLARGLDVGLLQRPVLQKDVRALIGWPRLEVRCLRGREVVARDVETGFASPERLDVDTKLHAIGNGEREQSTGV